MIYRNSLEANHVTWMFDQTAEAPEIARQFLHDECEILRLSSVANSTVGEVEAFLRASAGAPLSVYRSAAGDVLVRAEDDDLLITGKTAEVLCGYIDRDVVRTEDRLDMTLRRVIGL